MVTPLSCRRNGRSGESCPQEHYGFDTFEYCPSSIWETINKEKLLIIPNPFVHTATIRFNNPEKSDYSMIISDVMGKQVEVQENINGNNLTINKGTLSPGIYFVIVFNQTKKFKGKMVLQ